MTQAADFDCTINNLHSSRAGNGLQGMRVGQRIPAAWVEIRSAVTITKSALENMKTSLKSSIEYIKSDLFRYTGSISLVLFLEHMVMNKCFKYTFWLRLTNTRNLFVRTIARMMHHHLSVKYCISIPRMTRIGYGLYLAHPMCIVVNPSAKIGNNCNLSQFTTIGTNHDQAAAIGDNVYIGPSVCIVEDVNVGKNSTIGAGAVVVKDVPENVTVAGNPAKVISEKSPARYINHQWPIQNRAANGLDCLEY